MSDIHSTKRCKQCGVEKALEEFTAQKNGKYGRTSRCRLCVNINHRAHRDRVNPPDQRPINIRRRLAEQGLKKCSGCGEIKAFSEFRKTRRPDGYIPGPLCRPCDSARCADWEARNKEYRLEYHRQHGRRPETLERKRAYKRKMYLGNVRYVMAILLRHALKRRPTDNPATRDELWEMWDKSGGRCAISGIQMVWGKGRVMPNSLSLDRIDADQGYSKGNVRLVCHAINAFRGRMTDAEMLDMAKAIVANLDRPAPPPGLLALAGVT